MFKRNILIVFTLSVLMFLTGCSDSQEKYALSFYREDGQLIDVIEDLDREEVALPYYERDGLHFVGWDDGSDIYTDSYIVSANTILTAVFEDSSEVFEFYYHEESDTLYLTGYTGISKKIKIPEQHDGHYINAIRSYAFKDSDILSVLIPMTVTQIKSFAFEDASDLREVGWYGAPRGFLEVKSVLKEDLNEDLLAYGDDCIVTSVDGNISQYSSNCPIVQTVKSESIFVGDVEYYTYDVTYDLALAHDKQSQRIESYAFKGVLSLESFEIPAGLIANNISGEVFQDAPLLSQISVDEKNPYYQVVDGVLYNETMEYLYYYPNGLNDTSYVIPDSVKNVSPYAFYLNETLEEIVISENMEGTNESFIGLYGLKAFVVDENNPWFYTQDGVLFLNIGVDILIAYPGGKADEIYEIPEGTSMIFPSAFAYNSHLKDLVINDDLLTIGSNAFSYTTGIEVLEIPGSVEELNGYMIQNSQIHTVIITSDPTLNIPVDYHSFIIERIYDSVEKPYTYADVYISDDIYDDYMIMNGLERMTEFYHKLSEYEE